MEGKNIPDILLILNADNILDNYKNLNNALSSVFVTSSEKVAWLTTPNDRGESPLDQIREGRLESVAYSLEQYR